MKKLLKFLILSNILHYGCYVDSNNYLKNKFQIKDFTLLPTDSCIAKLNFEVEYYSDSTNLNRFSDAIEKGQDGTNSKIMFYGETKGCSNEDNSRLLDLDEISSSFNKKVKMFRGEMIQKGFSVNFSKLNNPKEVFMVVENIKTGDRDTILNNIILTDSLDMSHSNHHQKNHQASR